jgi:DNA-binding XRE family transcriptional regulator
MASVMCGAAMPSLSTNRTEPEVRLIPHIIDILGYVPYDSTWFIGERLRVIRSALGLSQEQLTRRAGLDESTIAKWEREGHNPRWDCVGQLAEAAYLWASVLILIFLKMHSPSSRPSRDF